VGSNWALGLFNHRWVLRALIVGLSIYAAGSFAITVANSFSRTGGTDLFTYWRINHFIRQGEDPYEAFLNRSEIRLPVRYIDGQVATAHPIAQTDVLQKLPGNSPPMLFLLLPLSLFSWPIAKAVWMIVSIVLVLATPWLAIRLFPVSLKPLLWVMMVLVFYGMPSTRAAVVTGQTGVVAIFLVLLTLMLVRSDRRWLGGLALGIALSKFSVGIPLLIFLLYKRKWATLAVAMGVQVAGFIAIAMLRPGSPVDVFADFASIAAAHSSLSGIHLTGLFSPTTLTSVMVGAIFSVAVFAPLWFHISKLKARDSRSELHDFTVFAVLCLWTLLVAYHRGYDIGLALPSLALLLFTLSGPSTWGVKHYRLNWMPVLFLVGILFLSLPVRFIDDVLGAWWEPFVIGSTTVVLLLLLTASLLFFRQLNQLRPANSSTE